MKKVLLLFDGPNFSENTLSFVQRLHLLSPLLVTAVFAPIVSLANMWSYAATGEAGAPAAPPLGEEGDELMLQHIRRFELLCQASHIPYRVHKDLDDLALPALKRESRFADLLVLSSETFYNGILFSDPFQYLHNALHDAECPVLVLPEKSSFPAHVLIAYDGSRESTYALRQFAYLFPEFLRLETTLIHSGKGADRKVPEAGLVGELVGTHFRNATYQHLDLSDRNSFQEWIGQRPDTILVAGSFSRGGFSELFRESFCATIIREHRLPVFVAHH
ncbi:MAG: hypothetical protein EOO16_01490 [Chitinophagaceae bacterium]|nr:MAG: hypothetical protein EOO16_01490 [Chitinophagaceae bacterium]